MSKKNDDFFVKKKPWSTVKDGLLGCYLTPYVSKILHTHKPSIYVDCFAGKGKFEDGEPGSPIIAMDIFKNALTTTKIDGNVRFEAAFIDLNYSSDLETNLRGYSKAQVIAGAYEDVIDDFLKSKTGYNVFLYIDPYGIKALDCSKFDSFAGGRFNTIELLINMNSFGFIREACNALGTNYTLGDTGFFDELIEYNPTVLDATDSSIEALNRIAGGEYWKKIIMKYKRGEIDGYQAEECFSKQYCQRLRKKYKYVLNMPIRIKNKQHSKYRMIHATNHPAGCVLMADNICNRWNLLKDIQNGGQMTLFQEDLNNQIIEEYMIRDYVEEHYSQYNQLSSITETHAMFFVQYGAICKTGDINKVLLELEREGRLMVERAPKIRKSGKPTRFMTEGHGQTVSIKWVK